MDASDRHIDVDRQGDIFCVHLRSHRYDESAIQELAQELTSLILQQGCRKLALSLGPESPQCLYSVFLAKLVTLRRLMAEKGGEFKICDANEQTLGVFEACRLKDHFEFVPDLQTAVAAWQPAS
jgi:hypothetical protein